MTGIILSGGGARGFAHVGVLKALAEMDIKPGMISGVSAGAVIGAYYAAGFKLEDIVDIVSRTKLFRLLDFNFRKPGSLFTTDAVKESLEKHLDGLTFSNLEIPLTVVATDLQNGQSHYISEGNLVQAVLASSAIPVMYQ
ncbi:MAG: patatin-like phospholipase family protein, partial [Bacteroidia bacterium]|nr:patatin-like phospholipase family protein [Bacteroidia bacterium]